MRWQNILCSWQGSWMFKSKKKEILFWVPQNASLANGQRPGGYSVVNLLLAEGPLVILVTVSCWDGQRKAASISPSNLALLPFSLAKVTSSAIGAPSWNWGIFCPLMLPHIQLPDPQTTSDHRVSFLTAKFTLEIFINSLFQPFSKPSSPLVWTTVMSDDWSPAPQPAPHIHPLPEDRWATSHCPMRSWLCVLLIECIFSFRLVANI